MGRMTKCLLILISVSLLEAMEFTKKIIFFLPPYLWICFSSPLSRKFINVFYHINKEPERLKGKETLPRQAKYDKYFSKIKMLS